MIEVFVHGGVCVDVVFARVAGNDVLFCCVVVVVLCCVVCVCVCV